MRKFFSTLEFPTLALLGAVYAVLVLLVVYHHTLPWWIILAVGSYAGCLHSSLQHEALHGHPTGSRLVNELLVFISPLCWLPYTRYRDMHLAHHNDMNLTCPVRDPESYYLLPDAWGTMPGLKRQLYSFNNTLFGRMLIGPAVSIVSFWGDEIGQMLRGRRDIIKCWGMFALSNILVVSFVIWCAMPLWQYFLLIAYPGISLALVRSYCEHQAAESIGHRTIIVEASPFWSLLFLNNNLHIAHHQGPKISWYKLPAYYRTERQNLINKNGNYLMKGYSEIFRRFFFHAKEPVSHPNTEWLKNH